MHMAVGGDEKPKFRCLDAGRYAVAFTVAVIVLVAIVHAIVTVLRPGDLFVRLDGGHVSVNVSKESPNPLSFTFKVDAFTTGQSIFVEGPGHSAKAKKPSAKSPRKKI